MRYIVCPECHAPIPKEQDKEHVYSCDWCGTVFMLEDEDD